MADQANLPSQADLNSLYGAWNPMSYIQGYQNQDLAAQFREQSLQQQQNATKKGTLENTQAEAMNPMLLEHQGLANTNQGLVNTGQTNANVVSGNTAELSTANQQAALDKQIRAAGISASEDEIKQMENHITQGLQSKDPTVFNLSLIHI